MSKVWGKENPADLLTKFLDNQTMLKHMEHFNIQYMSGRSAEAPTLSGLNFISQCLYALCGAEAYAPTCAAAVVHMFGTLRRAGALSTHSQTLMADANGHQPRGGARFLYGNNVVRTQPHVAHASVRWKPLW